MSFDGVVDAVASVLLAHCDLRTATALRATCRYVRNIVAAYPWVGDDSPNCTVRCPVFFVSAWPWQNEQWPHMHVRTQAAMLKWAACFPQATALYLTASDARPFQPRRIMPFLPALHALPNLTKLCITRYIVREDAAELAAALLQLPRLQRLSFTQTDMMLSGPLYDALARMPQLQGLAVHGHTHHIRDEGAVGLAALLAGDCFPQLDTLCLTGCNVSDEGIVALAAALPHAPRLQVLMLQQNVFGDGGAIALAGVLPQLPHLREFAVAHSCVGLVGMRALETAVSACTSLQLVHCDYNTNNRVSMRPAVYEALPHVCRLDLTTRSDDDARQAAAALARTPRVHTLRFSRLSSDTAHEGALWEAIAALPLLHTLRLSGMWVGALTNSLTDTHSWAALCIAVAATGTRTLRNLSISVPGVIARDVELAAVAFRFRPLLALKSLSLGGDSNWTVDSNTATLVADTWLPHMPSLKHLQLQGLQGSMTLEAAEALARALRHLPRLTFLRCTVMYNDMSANSVLVLARAMHAHTTAPMVTLSVSVTTATEYTVRDTACCEAWGAKVRIHNHSL